MSMFRHRLSVPTSVVLGLKHLELLGRQPERREPSEADREWWSGVFRDALALRDRRRAERRKP